MPKDCLELSDGDKIDISGEVYRVTRKDFVFNEENFHLFVFDSTSEEMKRNSNSSEELGIISSSIAHELNNPIAGILTAISVLELEDNWDEDSMDSLDDMKSAARRCQELIKVFLGFSRLQFTRVILVICMKLFNMLSTFFDFVWLRPILDSSFKPGRARALSRVLEMDPFVP